MIRRLVAGLLAPLTLAVAGPALAAVERIDVLERTPFAPGVSFGLAGPDEKIREEAPGLAEQGLGMLALADGGSPGSLRWSVRSRRRTHRVTRPASALSTFTQTSR
jgi:hypothetical protein